MEHQERRIRTDLQVFAAGLNALQNHAEIDVILEPATPNEPTRLRLEGHSVSEPLRRTRRRAWFNPPLTQARGNPDGPMRRRVGSDVSTKLNHLVDHLDQPERCELVFSVEGRGPGLQLNVTGYNGYDACGAVLDTAAGKGPPNPDADNAEADTRSRQDSVRLPSADAGLFLDGLQAALAAAQQGRSREYAKTLGAVHIRAETACRSVIEGTDGRLLIQATIPMQPGRPAGPAANVRFNLDVAEDAVRLGRAALQIAEAAKLPLRAYIDDGTADGKRRIVLAVATPDGPVDHELAGVALDPDAHERDYPATTPLLEKWRARGQEPSAWSCSIAARTLRRFTAILATEPTEVVPIWMGTRTGTPRDHIELTTSETGRGPALWGPAEIGSTGRPICLDARVLNALGSIPTAGPKSQWQMTAVPAETTSDGNQICPAVVIELQDNAGPSITGVLIGMTTAAEQTARADISA